MSRRPDSRGWRIGVAVFRRALDACPGLLLSGCIGISGVPDAGGKDLSDLKTGVPRAQVIAEFGKPLNTVDRAGELSDTFAIKQEAGRDERAEASTDRPDVTFRVVYDDEHHVRSVDVFDGDEIRPRH